MSSFSQRRSAMIWTGILAFLLTIVAGGIWTALLLANLTISPAIPWSVAVMAVLLWLMWRYLGGHWGPERTKHTRRYLLRATPLPTPMLAWALIAGMLSIVALAGLWLVLFQVANLPARSLVSFGAYPVWTVALALLMASLVSSLAEEAGFRGYFQGTLEHHMTGLAAIVVGAVVIAPAHALTQGFVWPTLVFYLCADFVFGLMAYLTQSIIPGAVVHAIGLLTFFTLVWPGDALRHIIATGDNAAWLWIHTAQVVLFGALAALAFYRLARLRRSSHAMDNIAAFRPRAS